VSTHLRLLVRVERAFVHRLTIHAKELCGAVRQRLQLQRALPELPLELDTAAGNGGDKRSVRCVQLGLDQQDEAAGDRAFVDGATTVAVPLGGNARNPRI
jgi:hypothetical protein